MRKTWLAVSLLLAGLAGGAAAPAAAQPQFSATMVQTLPQNKTMSGKIHMGAERMRTEMSHDGRTRITIVDSSEQVAWMLNPAKMEYVEMRGQGGGAPAGGPTRMPLPQEPDSPCNQPEADFTCNHLGAETVNGRRTQKWELISSHEGKTYRTVAWFDPELRIPVRQEYAGGMVSELKDIRVGPQPQRLFRIPEGYTRIQMPQRGGGTQGGYGGGSH